MGWRRGRGFSRWFRHEKKMVGLPSFLSFIQYLGRHAMLRLLLPPPYKWNTEHFRQRNFGNVSPWQAGWKLKRRFRTGCESKSWSIFLCVRACFFCIFIVFLTRESRDARTQPALAHTSWKKKLVQELQWCCSLTCHASCLQETSGRNPLATVWDHQRKKKGSVDAKVQSTNDAWQNLEHSFGNIFLVAYGV